MAMPQHAIAGLIQQRNVAAIQQLINIGVLRGNSTFLLQTLGAQGPLALFSLVATRPLHILYQPTRIFSMDPQALAPLPPPADWNLTDTLELSRTFLADGANINLEDAEGNRPLELAIRLRPPRFELVKFLVEQGATIQEQDIIHARIASNAFQQSHSNTNWKSSHEFMIYQYLSNPARRQVVQNIPGAARLAATRAAFEDASGITAQSQAGNVLQQFMGGPQLRNPRFPVNRTIPANRNSRWTQGINTSLFQARRRKTRRH